MKKIISITLVCVMILSLAQITALGAYTVPEVAETQFSEDFEAYQLINDYDSTRYWDVKDQKNSAYSGEIYNGIPADGNYSDTTLYPNGTAGVYEGNLDDSGNTYVHDYTYKNAAAANEGKIIGGTVDIGQDDGWYGYTNSTGQQFNASNRRLAVFNIAGTSDVNKTQYAILQPKAGTGKNTYSSLNRNNIALDGYSYLTARVSASSITGYDFTKAGISLTKNPVNNTYDTENEIVYFVPDDEANENTLDVVFNGARVAEITNSRFAYSASGTKAVAKTEYTGEWYTIQYRLWVDGDVKKHNLTLIDDTTKEVIYKSGWKTMHGDFEFDAETYGLRFYAQSSEAAITCMRLDDINFYNKEFVDDFNSINTQTAVGQYSRIGNGPKGDMNITAVYGNDVGVYGGSVAKNVAYYRTLKADLTGSEFVFGNVTNWQGYVEKVANSSGGVIQHAGDLRNVDNFPCNIRAYGCNTGTNALCLRASALRPTASQTVYAGMQETDFSDITKISATVRVHQLNSKGETFSFQLTKGRNTFVAGRTNYDDSTITAKYDVFTMTADGKIKVGDVEIGNYSVDNQPTTGCYKFEYVVDQSDAENPKHSLKITDVDTKEVVATMDATDMNLTAGASSFNFENGINGFRFVADAPNYTSSSDYSDIIAYVDDVKVSKTLPDSFNDVSDIKDAVYSAENKKLTFNADMEETHEAGNIVLFAVYAKEGEILEKLYKYDCTELVADANELEFTVNEEYDAENYFGKVFLWKDLTNLNPVTKCADVTFSQSVVEE